MSDVLSKKKNAFFLSFFFCSSVMDCPSISPLSLCSQTKSHNLNIFTKLELFNRHQRNLLINPTHFTKSLYFHPKTHINSFSNSTQSPLLLQKPISNSLKIQCSSCCTPQPNFFKPIAEKLAILILGSLLFMARFNYKPALALSTKPTTSYSEIMRDNNNTPRGVEALKVVLYEKMRKGETNEAVKYVEKLIDIEPNEVEWRLLQALSYEMMGQLSKAKRLFKDILKKRPLLLRALHGLAMVMHKNHEDPFTMLNKALEVASSEKRVTEERNIQILIAQMHVVKGELEEGLKKFQHLVDENPRDFRPYLCQGIIYSLLDKKKEAEEQFETYRSLVPNEFPQRGFLDDVVLSAKSESREQLQKEFKEAYSYKK